MQCVTWRLLPGHISLDVPAFYVLFSYLFISLIYHSSTFPTTTFLLRALIVPQNPVPKDMEAAHQSFFLDAISDGTTQSLADNLMEMPESRDTEHDVTTVLSGSNMTGLGNTIEPTKMPECSDPPQALVIFVLGEHRFSDSCELGVMNEHPEALQAITFNQCLSTSAFLEPALHAAMAELRPSMMVQVAVRLTAITLRLVVKILQT